MKKMLAFLFTIAVLVVGVMGIRAYMARHSDMPTRVRASQWIPISPSCGVYLLGSPQPTWRMEGEFTVSFTDGRTVTNQPFERIPERVICGLLYAKVNGEWLRIETSSETNAIAASH
jgi:hypothetical protein